MKNEKMRYLSLLFLLGISLSASPAHAQKVLQIEKYGQAKTEKIYIGTGIEYRLKDSKEWRYAVIEGLNTDQNLIVLADRYLDPEKIDAFRYYRPNIKRLGIQVMTFGVAWSGYALIGTAFDRDPSTHYRLSDGIVTAAALASGFSITQLFKYKKVRFGKRKRLRMVDITF